MVRVELSVELSWVARGVALVPFCLALFCACRAEPTQLLVVVDSNLPAAMVSRVEIEVRSPDTPEGAGQTRTIDIGPAPRTSLPFSFGVAPRKGESVTDQTVLIRVSALDEAGAFVVDREARVGFVRNKTLRLLMFLAAECIDQAAICEARGQVCDRGDCIDEFVDPTLLVEVTPGEEFVDAGALDAATDALDDTADAADAPTVLRAPAVLYPWNGVAVARAPELRWRSSAPLTRDELQWGSNCSADDYLDCVPDMEITTTASGTSTTVTVDPSSDPGRYYWRVRSCLEGLCSPYTETRYFDLGRTDADTDGDGNDDIVAGAPGFDDLQADQGLVWWYPGVPDDAFPMHTVIPPGSFSAGLQFGKLTAFAGDTDRDGRGDVVVVSTLGWSLFMGTAARRPVSGPSDALAGIEAVAGAGDLDGDGYADILFGRPFVGDGEVEILFGGGMDRVTVTAASEGPPGQEFGASVASVGDVNGDGLTDFVVGAPGFDASRGRAYVLEGSRTRDFRVARLFISPTGTPGSRSGATVIGLGDVDGDFVADLAVAAPMHDLSDGEPEAGRVVIYSGIDFAEVASLDGDVAGRHFGDAMAPLGNVDGDANGDFLVGGGGEGAGNVPGRAEFFVGPRDSGGAALDPDPIDGTRFGQRVTSGDYDGDGVQELVIAAPQLAGEGAILLYSIDARVLSLSADARFPAGPGLGLTTRFGRLAQPAPSRLR